MAEQSWSKVMRGLLHHNVPRFVAHIRHRGGISDEEVRWLQCTDDNPDYPGELLARADEYLLYPKNEEVFNQGLFVLVKTLAIMAFIPGGVRVFGLHFYSEIDNFFAIEDESET